MRKTLITFFASFIAFFAFISTAKAQFEGVIEFKKVSSSGTVNYIYYVKGNKVRIDEIGTVSKKIEGTSLIDLSTKKMINLNYARKLYMDQKPGNPTKIIGTPETTETNQTKTIAGVKCKEVVVTNKDDNTIVKYYFGGTKYNFLPNLLNFLNRKDKVAIYYPFQQGADMFPFLSVHTDLTGTEISRFEATKVEKKTVAADMFDIPKDFKKFEQ